MGFSAGSLLQRSSANLNESSGVFLVDSCFHPSEINGMNIGNSRALVTARKENHFTYLQGELTQLNSLGRIVPLVNPFQSRVAFHVQSFDF